MRVEDSNPFEVVQTEYAGRCIRTTRAVRQGELILYEKALFCSPDRSKLAEIKRDLFVDDAPIQRESSVPLATQVFFVVLTEMIMQPSSELLSRFEQLQGHVECWRTAATTLWECLRPHHQSRIEKEDLVVAFAKVAANAHESASGCAAVFVTGSFAEHNCSPSAFKEVISHRGTDAESLALNFYALRDLAEGEHVSISYIPEYNPTWRRRELLKKGYNFHCQCNRCDGDAAEVTYSFLCPECEDGPCQPLRPCAVKGELGALACAECGYETENPDVVKSFVAADACDTLCSQCAPVFHPQNYKIFNMYMSNLGAAPPQQRLSMLEQLEAAHEALTGNALHPLRAGLLEKTAEALAQLQRAAEAADEYERAAELHAGARGGAPSVEASRCLARAAKLRGAGGTSVA
eukprot:TRINITY_DN47454_c0_g1_i1.p1 TRINITY_DN47454_c0_g1~~TRINITY_DN47454_c0_g1_i1.p1  ORF type:complete len:406 (-),score=55.02 TRINITY_DN47454_c0_g1_i1:89-1306(-)